MIDWMCYIITYPARMTILTYSPCFNIFQIQDVSKVLFSWEPYRSAIEKTKTASLTLIPHSHGFYLPALEKLKIVLEGDSECRGESCSGCATNVLFLSDGKPSDPTPRGPEGPAEKSSMQIG